MDMFAFRGNRIILATMKQILYLTLKIQGQGHDKNRPKSNQVIYRSGPTKVCGCGRRWQRTNRYKIIKSPPVYQGDLITEHQEYTHVWDVFYGTNISMSQSIPTQPWGTQLLATHNSAISKVDVTNFLHMNQGHQEWDIITHDKKPFSTHGRFSHHKIPTLNSPISQWFFPWWWAAWLTQISSYIITTIWLL